MVFRIKKELYKTKEDFALKPQDGSFVLRVAAFRKGYYVYNASGAQTAQIVFGKERATVSVADGASMTVIKNYDNTFAVIDTMPSEEEKKKIKDPSKQKKSSLVYMIYGNVAAYNYDIYEKRADQKLPVKATIVINDIFEQGWYKVKITESVNTLRTLMICLALDRLSREGRK
jgi:hypothetical protein